MPKEGELPTIKSLPKDMKETLADIVAAHESTFPGKFSITKKRQIAWLLLDGADPEEVLGMSGTLLEVDGFDYMKRHFAGKKARLDSAVPASKSHIPVAKYDRKPKEYSDTDCESEDMEGEQSAFGQALSQNNGARLAKSLVEVKAEKINHVVFLDDEPPITVTTVFQQALDKSGFAERPLDSARVVVVRDMAEHFITHVIGPVINSIKK